MQRRGAGGRIVNGGAVAYELCGVYPMTAEIIPIKHKDHLAEVKAGLTLLEMFERTGGHNKQTRRLVAEQMEIDLQHYREQLKGR